MFLKVFAGSAAALTLAASMAMMTGAAEARGGDKTSVVRPYGYEDNTRPGSGGNPYSGQQYRGYEAAPPVYYERPRCVVRRRFVEDYYGGRYVTYRVCPDY